MPIPKSIFLYRQPTPIANALRLVIATAIENLVFINNFYIVLFMRNIRKKAQSPLPVSNQHNIYIAHLKASIPKADSQGFLQNLGMPEFFRLSLIFSFQKSSSMGSKLKNEQNEFLRKNSYYHKIMAAVDTRQSLLLALQSELKQESLYQIQVQRVLKLIGQLRVVSITCVFEINQWVQRLSEQRRFNYKFFVGENQYFRKMKNDYSFIFRSKLNLLIGQFEQDPFFQKVFQQAQGEGKNQIVQNLQLDPSLNQMLRRASNILIKNTKTAQSPRSRVSSKSKQSPRSSSKNYERRQSDFLKKINAVEKRLKILSQQKQRKPPQKAHVQQQKIYSKLNVLRKSIANPESDYINKLQLTNKSFQFLKASSESFRRPQLISKSKQGRIMRQDLYSSRQNTKQQIKRKQEQNLQLNKERHKFDLQISKAKQKLMSQHQSLLIQEKNRFQEYKSQLVKQTNMQLNKYKDLMLQAKKKLQSQITEKELRKRRNQIQQINKLSSVRQKALYQQFLTKQQMLKSRLEQAKRLYEMKQQQLRAQRLQKQRLQIKMQQKEARETTQKELREQLMAKMKRIQEEQYQRFCQIRKQNQRQMIKDLSQIKSQHQKQFQQFTAELLKAKQQKVEEQRRRESDERRALELLQMQQEQIKRESQARLLQFQRQMQQISQIRKPKDDQISANLDFQKIKTQIYNQLKQQLLRTNQLKSTKIPLQTSLEIQKEVNDILSLAHVYKPAIIKNKESNSQLQYKQQLSDSLNSQRSFQQQTISKFQHPPAQRVVNYPKEKIEDQSLLRAKMIKIKLERQKHLADLKQQQELQKIQEKKRKMADIIKNQIKQQKKLRKIQRILQCSKESQLPYQSDQQSAQSQNQPLNKKSNQIKLQLQKLQKMENQLAFLSNNLIVPQRITLTESQPPQWAQDSSLQTFTLQVYQIDRWQIRSFVNKLAQKASIFYKDVFRMNPDQLTNKLNQKQSLILSTRIPIQSQCILFKSSESMRIQFLNLNSQTQLFKLIQVISQYVFQRSPFKSIQFNMKLSPHQKLSMISFDNSFRVYGKIQYQQFADYVITHYVYYRPYGLKFQKEIQNQNSIFYQCNLLSFTANKKEENDKKPMKKYCNFFQILHACGRHKLILDPVHDNFSAKVLFSVNKKVQTHQSLPQLSSVDQLNSIQMRKALNKMRIQGDYIKQKAFKPFLSILRSQIKIAQGMIGQFKNKKYSLVNLKKTVYQALKGKLSKMIIIQGKRPGLKTFVIQDHQFTKKDTGIFQFIIEFVKTVELQHDSYQSLWIPFFQQSRIYNYQLLGIQFYFQIKAFYNSVHYFPLGVKSQPSPMQWISSGGYIIGQLNQKIQQGILWAIHIQA